MELGNLKFSILIKILLKTLLFISLFNILNGCGGGGTATSNAAAALSGGPISMTPLYYNIWGNEGTGIIRMKDNTSNVLAYTENMNDTLKADGQVSNPNDYEIVTIISESVDSYNVATIEAIIRYKKTGETGNAVIRGYEDAIIVDLVPTLSTSTGGFQVGGSKVIYMPVGTYNYNGYAELFYQDYNGVKTTEKGRFSMNADFGNDSASINASTASFSYSDNSIKIDRANGEFQGTNGEFDLPGSKKFSNTIMLGSFHGTTANSVTGMQMQYITREDGAKAYTKTLIAGER